MRWKFMRAYFLLSWYFFPLPYLSICFVVSSSHSFLFFYHHILTLWCCVWHMKKKNIFIFKCHRYVCRDVNEGIFHMFKGGTTPKITIKWKLKIKTIDCAWEKFLGVNFQNTSIAYSSKVKRRQIRYENLC